MPCTGRICLTDSGVCCRHSTSKSKVMRHLISKHLNVMLVLTLLIRVLVSADLLLHPQTVSHLVMCYTLLVSY